MAIRTEVERIDLTTTTDLTREIVDSCDIKAAKTPPLRLAASFASRDQVILIFQNA
jgi:hypothetical protein